MAIAAGHEAAVYAASRAAAPQGGATDRQIRLSWKRCLEEYGLEPSSIDVDVLSRSELAAHRDQLGEVIDIARAEMENLAAQIAGSGYALLLTDADGVILCHQAEASLEAGFRRAGLWDGADWSETRQGTNGIGTALIERRPVTVHCGDHFATRNIGLSCSAAPIHNPSGQLLGALDASSVQCEDTRASQMHTIALVNMSARLIEKCVFLNAFRDRMVLRFHSRPEFVNLVHDGMLAVDEDGRIAAADASAAIQLGCDQRENLVRRDIGEFFDVNYAVLSRRLSENSPTVWPLHEVRRGRRYFACVRAHGGAEVEGNRGLRSPTGRRLAAPVARRAPAARPDLEVLQGSDPQMAHNIRCARRVVDRGIQIMVHGETGTGKEVFARAAHNASSRADRPFVAVNCAAIPESLIEAELFGYKSGAFTGARREGMRGKILQSSGGTLFLDEIGDMPVELQTRLLRVLEEREVVPLGSESSVPVELNLISATHAPLKSLLAEGRFREDLYYRLNGITLTLPPVRERADRESLLREVLALEHDGADPVRVDPAAIAALMAYDWPGNIRQMRNVARTALALCEDEIIRVADLPEEIRNMAADGAAVSAGLSTGGADGRGNGVQASAAGDDSDPLAAAEREALLQALRENRWNITNTARQLRMSRNTLYRKMKKHSIEYASAR